MLFRLVTQILEKCKVWTDAIDCELRPTFVLTKACDGLRAWDKCILPCTEMQRYLEEWWQKSSICWHITRLQRLAYTCEHSCSCLLASAGAINKSIHVRYPASHASWACNIFYWNCERTPNELRPQIDEQCDVTLVKQLRREVWPFPIQEFIL